MCKVCNQLSEVESQFPEAIDSFLASDWPLNNGSQFEIRGEKLFYRVQYDQTSEKLYSWNSEKKVWT